MPLLTAAELRDLVQTDLADDRLQAIINREEAALVRKLGPHADGVTAVTELIPAGEPLLFLKRPAVSVTSISEGGVAVAATSYTIWATGQVERLGSRWAGWVSVTYVPEDDRDARKQVLIELCRLTLEQTAMRSESVAGEYSYQAPDWEAARARLYRRLTYFEV
jgi:hypothetical protein